MDLSAARRPSAGTLSRRSALAGLAGILGISATACSSGTAGGSTSGSEGAAGFPLELANCEATLTFDAPPQRIVLLESAPVTTLDGIGVLDRVVARAGVFPPGTTTRSSTPGSRRSRRSRTTSTPRATCRSPRRW